MPRLIKILHIDPDFQTTYFIYRPHSSIRTSVPLEKAIELLKTEDFDLIISEPHNKAILNKQLSLNEGKPKPADDYFLTSPRITGVALDKWTNESNAQNSRVQELKDSSKNNKPSTNGSNLEPLNP